MNKVYLVLAISAIMIGAFADSGFAAETRTSDSEEPTRDTIQRVWKAPAGLEAYALIGIRVSEIEGFGYLASETEGMSDG